jgi:hypothetical protein
LSASLNFSKDVTPYITLNISPNASLYIAINIAQYVATNVCAYIATNISFYTSFNVSIYIAADTALNVPSNITPDICIDLENPKLAVYEAKRDKLINFLDLRHSLRY